MMDTQSEKIKIQNWMEILLWLGILVFFVYSFKAVVDIENITQPRRQETFIRVLTALSKPNFSDGETSRLVVIKMLETVQIAFLATTISAVFAYLFTFLSARPSSFWGRGFNIILQPILSSIRSVHPLIIVILVIMLTGIDPTSGVLALTFFSTAVLIGIFSEYAQQHMSLSWPILFKIHFPGLTFKHLPVNILIATVLGFMGGGGIGFFLQQSFNLLDYRNASTAILVCIIVIGSLDLISRAVWKRIQKNSSNWAYGPPSSEKDDTGSKE